MLLALPCAGAAHSARRQSLPQGRAIYPSGQAKPRLPGGLGWARPALKALSPKVDRAARVPQSTAAETGSPAAGTQGRSPTSQAQGPLQGPRAWAGLVGCGLGSGDVGTRQRVRDQKATGEQRPVRADGRAPRPAASARAVAPRPGEGAPGPPCLPAGLFLGDACHCSH